MTAELKPLFCPFCGKGDAQFSQHAVDTNDGWGSVLCVFCGADGPYKATEAEAIAAWRRAQPEPAAPAHGSAIDLAIHALQWHVDNPNNSFTDEPRKRDCRAIRALRSVDAAPSVGTAPVDLDYHCTIKCSSCGKKNYFTRRELEESHLRATDAAPSVAPEPVAWRYQDARGHYRYRAYKPGFDVEYAILKPVPLYAAHPPRAPLTEAREAPGTVKVEGYGYVDLKAVRAIEAAHGISAAAIGAAK